VKQLRMLQRCVQKRGGASATERRQATLVGVEWFREKHARAEAGGDADVVVLPIHLEG
jgi:hypothetical protein